MLIIFILIFIFLTSFILAYRSMVDMEAPKEIRKFINKQRLNGTIIFLKKKIKHYSSSLSSSSEE